MHLHSSHHLSHDRSELLRTNLKPVAGESQFVTFYDLYGYLKSTAQERGETSSSMLQATHSLWRQIFEGVASRIPESRTLCSLLLTVCTHCNSTYGECRCEVGGHWHGATEELRAWIPNKGSRNWVIGVRSLVEADLSVFIFYNPISGRRLEAYVADMLQRKSLTA